MKTLIIILLLIYFPPGDKDQAIRSATDGFRQGSSSTLEPMIGTMAELRLPDHENTYSRAQAGQILKDFFRRNPVEDFRLTRQGSAREQSWFLLGELDAGNNRYSVYVVFREEAGSWKIRKIEIEKKPE